jgi:hypothetical protein
LRTDIVRPPDDPGTILKYHGHPYQWEDLHGFREVENSVDNCPLKEIAEDKKNGRAHQKREEGIDSRPEEYGIGDIHAPDHHLAMGKIDDPHHTKNKGEA